MTPSEPWLTDCHAAGVDPLVIEHTARNFWLMSIITRSEAPEASRSSIGFVTTLSKTLPNCPLKPSRSRVARLMSAQCVLRAQTIEPPFSNCSSDISKRCPPHADLPVTS